MSATSQRLPELPGKPQQRKLNSSRDDPFFCKVVQKYRSHVFAQRIRLREIFQDFDPLRCGLMTESRFGRCIATSMAKGAVLPLNVEEVEVLIKYFGSPNTGKVRWREFVDTIDTGLFVLI